MEILNGGAFSLHQSQFYGTFDYGEAPPFFDNIVLTQDNHIVDTKNYLYFGQVREDN
jgi:hypothetical protein